MAEQESGSGVFIIGFMLGAAAGVAAALMMAPRSGEETVGQIRERSVGLRMRAGELGGQAREQAAQRAQRVQELGGQMRSQTSGQLHKAQDDLSSRRQIVLQQAQSRVQGAVEKLEEAERRAGKPAEKAAEATEDAVQAAADEFNEVAGSESPGSANPGADIA